MPGTETVLRLLQLRNDIPVGTAKDLGSDYGFCYSTLVCIKRLGVWCQIGRYPLGGKD